MFSPYSEEFDVPDPTLRPCDFEISPPTSKRIKTSAASAPPHLLAQQQLHPFHRVPTFEGIPIPSAPIPQQTSSTSRKRPPSPSAGPSGMMASPMPPASRLPLNPLLRKRGRTNTPWTAEEEQRLKTMRDAGRSWSEIAKTFPTRTEGSVKKHWYKDMHYAEFAEDESIKLREAIKEYEANKWKVIGQKVGKPAKACEQYAKEHFKTI
ncbi:hypothetical protein N7495_008262 [Penicillium taxi]|uniref:uncharacterized protein n=1 Tax=Penicillium taxi TaxID=168475 RepID=UPI002544F6B4|nr:uncharacterized protein N7495_008262 [Penicillium taxi]KAJ5888221.1 hypothetical protein N7495_008262 [Penicillium taxi]